MLRFGFCSVVVVALLLLAGNFTVADEQLSPFDSAAYYGACIDRIIDKCASKQSLSTSSSPALRAYADRMAQKNSFCRNHKDQLIQSMLTHEIKPKFYKVEHFVNRLFYLTQVTAKR